MKCLNCNKETNNPKFCGHSCSASYNNKTVCRIKKIPHYCKCGKEIERKNTLNGNYYTKLCNDCYSIIYHNGNVTKAYYKKVSPTAYFTYIRTHARNVIKKSNIEQKCKICGYSNHVEVCHIKAISEFSDETLVSEINSLDNLIILCPNHHWEFDKGLINL